MRITSICFLLFYFFSYLETNYRNKRNFLVILIMVQLCALRQFVSFFFTFLPFYLYMIPMHEVVPSAVSAAVMMLASTWRTILHPSLFFIVYLLSRLRLRLLVLDACQILHVDEAALLQELAA